MSRTRSRRCWQTKLVPFAAVWCMLYYKRPLCNHRYLTVSISHLLFPSPSLLH